MSFVARRRLFVGMGLALGIALLAGSTGAQAAAKKAAAKKPAAKTTEVKGKVTAFANNVLRVDNKKSFKLQPAKTKVVTSRGAVSAKLWTTAIAVGDQVVVTVSNQVPISVKVLPPARLKDGVYLSGVTTTYNHIASPNAEPVPVSLLWLYPTTGKKVRYLVQIEETTKLLGAFVEAGAAGPEAIRTAIQKDMEVKITMSKKAPTIEKYGDVNNAYFINGVAAAVEILSPPEQEPEAVQEQTPNAEEQEQTPDVEQE